VAVGPLLWRGKTLVVKMTVPVKPLTLVSVMFEPAEELAGIAEVAGLMVILKSGTTLICERKVVQTPDLMYSPPTQTRVLLDGSMAAPK